MADFQIALNRLLQLEGLYSNDKKDLGGETIFGISRIANPDWKGWELVDKGHWRENADILQLLRMKAEIFYRSKYWDKIKGDDILLQSIANRLFDISVNMGIAIAVRYLQYALNVFNDEQIEEDGMMGDKTLKSLNGFLKLNNSEFYIDQALICQQGNRYLRIAHRLPTQKRFIKGWFNRIGKH